MKSAWAIAAFVDAHPIWKSVRKSLSVKSNQDSWDYIYFQGSRIGRVKVEGRSIIAESFVSTTNLDTE